MNHGKTGATVYTDSFGGYHGLAGHNHQTVDHKAGEYEREMARANEIESFWALLKRGYYFVYFPLGFTNGSGFNGPLLARDYGSLV